MIATAYNYASGGDHQSNEITIGRLIDRFGVHAVMGRPYLGALEVISIYAAEKVLKVYREKESSSSWAEWAQANPEDAAYLARAIKAAEEEGFIDG